jgi:AraC family transcriptional regulator
MLWCRRGGNRVSVNNENKHLSEFDVHSLLKAPTVTIRDTYCRGTCRCHSPEECTITTQLVFPYRGVYARHVGQNQVVAEANHVLFFNAMEGYRVSHPVSGGDASLTLIIEESQLHELAPPSLLQDGPRVAFRQPRLRIDARTQALAALLRHSLREKTAEPLERQKPWR